MEELKPLLLVLINLEEQARAASAAADARFKAAEQEALDLDERWRAASGAARAVKDMIATFTTEEVKS